MSQVAMPPGGASAALSCRKSTPGTWSSRPVSSWPCRPGQRCGEHRRMRAPWWAGAGGMACVGGSVAVSGTLSAAPLMTTQAVRYALAVGLLLGIARLTGRRVPMPRGVEWLWLVGVAVAGLVLFNVALVRGRRARRARGVRRRHRGRSAGVGAGGRQAAPGGGARRRTGDGGGRPGGGRGTRRPGRARLGGARAGLRGGLHAPRGARAGQARPVGGRGALVLDRVVLLAAIGWATRARRPC